MKSRQLRAIAVRVAYHIGQKLPALHGHPTRTLVMMVSAFLAAGGPVLSEMGRALADLPGSLTQKVKRMSRFLCRSEWDVFEAFAAVGQKIVETMAHAFPTKKILLALDWTDLGEFWGLWLSLPYQGRALPLVGQALAKVSGEGSLTYTEGELLRRFLTLFSSEIRGRIVILADRGFAKRELFEDLNRLGVPWVIRLPRDRHLDHNGQWIELRELGIQPGQTLLAPHVRIIQKDPIEVNLAIRRLRPGEANDPDDDTWYLATSAEDLQESLSWYSQRFQIEEMFRDLKDRLHMDRHRLQTEESMGKMMLIIALAYLVILEDGTQWRSRTDLMRIQKNTAWGKLSIFRIAWACFEACLSEPSEEAAQIIVSRWMNRRAA